MPISAQKSKGKPAHLFCALLLLLPFAAIAHAQCYGGPLSPIPAFTLTPQYWAPGQSNIPITVTSNPGSFVAYTPPPYDVPDTAYILTQASYYAEDWFTEDPNVTVTLPV